MRRQDQRPRRRGGVLRYLRGAFAVGGMARGVTHGHQGGPPSDHLAARAAAQEHLRGSADDEQDGILDRVPGALVLAMAVVVVIAVYLLGR